MNFDQPLPFSLVVWKLCNRFAYVAVVDNVNLQIFCTHPPKFWDRISKQIRSVERSADVMHASGVTDEALKVSRDWTRGRTSLESGQLLGYLKSSAGLHSLDNLTNKGNVKTNQKHFETEKRNR